MSDNRKPNDSTQGAPRLEPGDQAAPGTPGAGENVCPICRGTGKANAAACTHCGGTGVVIEGISGG